MIPTIVTKILRLFGLQVLADDIYRRYRPFLAPPRVQNVRFKNQVAPDELPIPPLELTSLVTEKYDTELFLRSGVQGAQCIEDILKKNGLEINSFWAILDFGCGCGRILRNWNALYGPKIHGSDYNKRLVSWCQESLSFAEVRLNKPSSKLDYEDDKFDFIYAISVFTHLSEDLQGFWINELKRVLRPGGYLLITVHGTTRMSVLSPTERQRYDSGQLVVRNERYAGKNSCGEYHPEEYVRSTLCAGLRVVDFVPGGAKDADQDQYLFQK
jgi:ubiquinone/menaquinone biosynthesis C-methylase UbiE